MMKYKLKTILILFLFLFTSSQVCFGEVDFKFRSYRVEDGLSQNTIWCSLQDSQGFIWIGTKDGLNRFDGRSFKVFRNIPDDPSSIGNNFIRSLYEDKNNRLWVGTDDGLYIYQPETEKFVPFDFKRVNSKQQMAVNSVVEDRHGNLWIGCFGEGVYVYSITTGNLKHFINGADEKSLYSNLIWKIYCDADGVVWIATLVGGLSRYDRTTDSFQTFQKGKYEIDNDIYELYEDSERNFYIGSWNEGLIKMNRENNSFTIYKEPEFGFQHIRSICELTPGELLIGADNGLFVFSTHDEKVRSVNLTDMESFADKTDAIYSILKDREGGYWIGGYFLGLNYFHDSSNWFEHYARKECKNSIGSNAVSQFLEDEKGNLWIATEDNGLSYFNTKTKWFENSRNNPNVRLSYHNLHALLIDGNHLWIGTFSKGIDVLDRRTGKVKNYSHINGDESSLSDNSVFSIYKDYNGNIYVGTINGLNLYDRQKDAFRCIEEIGRNTYVYDICQDHNGLLWFATYGTGVYSFNGRTKEWKNYRHALNNMHSLGLDKVISIYEDSRQRLWFGTEGAGLCLYREESDDFINYAEKDGLPNNVIYGIVDDKEGNLWLSSNKGLTCFSPDSLNVTCFSKSDGLQSDQFNYKSVYKTKAGKLYFGGVNGFNAFYPENIRKNTFVPPVCITGFQLFNQPVEIREENSPLERSISRTKKMVLKHNQSVISFEFVALSFVAPDKNQYAYIMEGFDKQWTYSGSDNKVSYTNLPSGNYVFKVKASNNDGVWNKECVELQLEILPPFYRSVPAYVLYTILIIVIGIFTIRYFFHRAERKHEHEIKLLEEEKEKEVYESKLSFFTNIAHEIRTPLSLINAPLEMILNSEQAGKEFREQLTVMKNNTVRLMSLVNQLLDFRKVEKGGLQLNYSRTDMRELLRGMYGRFHLLAEQKNIDLSLHLPDAPFYAVVDPESVTKIVSNLLTNAIKFTKSRIDLNLNLPVSESNPLFEISVTDDGKGIPDEYFKQIFQPFFQIDSAVRLQIPGTGIGLALVKSLVDLHDGSIKVEHAPAGGTIFRISLPVTTDKQNIANNLTHLMDSELEEPFINALSEESINKEVVDNHPSLLVVDDNDDLRIFLTKNLQNRYAVLMASNGVEALELLKKNDIEMVISDIIMPEMDGLELCKQIKNNQQWSHIPVILLTARGNLQSKLEGLEYGADAYIEKPFSIVFLQAQISNLFSNKERIRQSFANTPLMQYKSIANNRADEEFLNKLNDLIDTNIDNVDFCVDDLAQALNMSRSSLHRKIKGLSGIAPNDFIRLYRLKKAAVILSQNEYKVNEICYLVGFNTPSYFAKCFQKQFGMLPKDFQRKCAMENMDEKVTE